MTARMKDLIAGGLTSRDLTLARLARWVCPLQDRAHKMCFYLGIRDPTRTSAEVLGADELRRLAGQVITNVIKQKWWFRLEPFSRTQRSPVVSYFCRSFV